MLRCQTPLMRRIIAIQQGNDDAAQLAQLNSEIVRSVKGCRKLLFDCRSQLAAATNMPEFLDENERYIAG